MSSSENPTRLFSLSQFSSLFHFFSFVSNSGNRDPIRSECQTTIVAPNPIGSDSVGIEDATSFIKFPISINVIFPVLRILNLKAFFDTLENRPTLAPQFQVCRYVVLFHVYIPRWVHLIRFVAKVSKIEEFHQKRVWLHLTKITPCLNRFIIKTRILFIKIKMEGENLVFILYKHTGQLLLYNYFLVHAVQCLLEEWRVLIFTIQEAW